MATLLLVRHGETDWNADGRLQGHTDRPLSDYGRRQARELGDQLKEEGLEGEELEETRCAIMGVFAPLVGIVGATQAAEALKILAGAGESITGRLLLLDAFAMRWRDVRITRDPGCPVCSGS